MNKNNASAVIAVCPTEHPYEWMGKLAADKSIEHILNRFNRSHGSVHFSESYQINGSIYLMEVPRKLEDIRIFPEMGAYAYVMERQYSIDIDTSLDLVVAEAIMRNSLE